MNPPRPPFSRLPPRNVANRPSLVPFKLLLSASLASPFLVPETVRTLQPRPSASGPADTSRWVWAVFLIPSNALGAAVFARLAAALAPGVPIGSVSAAASAGAAFGAITFAARAATGIVACVQYRPYWGVSRGIMMDVFGHWEVVQPAPVRISEEEYNQILHASASAMATMVRHLGVVGERLVSGLVAVSYLVPGVGGADRMRLRESARGWRNGLERDVEGFRDGLPLQGDRAPSLEVQD